MFDRSQLEKELDEALASYDEEEIIITPPAKTYRVVKGRVIVFDNLPNEKWLTVFENNSIDVLKTDKETHIINTVKNFKILEKLGYTELPPAAGEPKVTRTWHPDGSLKTELWTVDEVPHRIDGPAYAAWYDNGKIQSEVWYAFGITHRIYGPAHKVWYENGMIFVEEYYVCGVNVIDKREWLDQRGIPTLPVGWTNTQLNTFVEEFKPKPKDAEVKQESINTSKVEPPKPPKITPTISGIKLK